MLQREHLVGDFQITNLGWLYNEMSDVSGQFNKYLENPK